MRLDYRISYLLSVFKKEFVEVYPMQDSAADGTAPAFDSTSNPLSLLLVQLQLSKPPRLGTRALEVTAPAALHPRACRGCAGGMGGPVQEGWWVCAGGMGGSVSARDAGAGAGSWAGSWGRMSVHRADTAQPFHVPPLSPSCSHEPGADRGARRGHVWCGVSPAPGAQPAWPWGSALLCVLPRLRAAAAEEDEAVKADAAVPIDPGG